VSGRRATAFASIAAIAALAIAVGELGGFSDFVADLRPRSRLHPFHPSSHVWLGAVAATFLRSFIAVAAAAPTLPRNGSRISVLAPIVVALAAVLSMRGAYVVAYRGLPSNTHVNIPRTQRYTPPLIVLAAAIVAAWLTPHDGAPE
jgi:hypothetical protein